MMSENIQYFQSKKRGFDSCLTGSCYLPLKHLYNNLRLENVWSHSCCYTYELQFMVQSLDWTGLRGR